jgi:nucleolar protein 14
MSLSQALDKIYSADTQDDELSGIALRAALSCLRQLARPVSKTPSASELLATVRISVTSIQKVLRKSDSRLADFCEDFVKELDDSLAGALKTPLTYHTKAAEAIKMYNPMYEEDGYQKGRDYDPNRERAEARKLKKQLKQESRGAMRELRKDNRFMADARAKEQAEAADERGARQKDILSFLEKQESDFKSGGQGGQIVKNKRRVSKGSRRAY